MNSGFNEKWMTEMVGSWLTEGFLSFHYWVMEEDHNRGEVISCDHLVQYHASLYIYQPKPSIYARRTK